MSAIARLRRQRQRERRAIFRDWDVVWLSLFIVLPPLAALVAYVLGSVPFRILKRWRGMQVTLTVEWLAQTPCVRQERRVRQRVPVAFYRAFEGER